LLKETTRGLIGLQPTTSTLRGRRTLHCASPP